MATRLAATSLLVVILLTTILAADPCVFDSKVWLDGQFRAEAGVCQVCSAGQWADRDLKVANPDQGCKKPEQSKSTRATRNSPNDCIFQGHYFSQNAVRQFDQDCRRCVS